MLDPRDLAGQSLNMFATQFAKEILITGIQLAFRFGRKLGSQAVQRVNSRHGGILFVQKLCTEALKLSVPAKLRLQAILNG